MKKVENSVLIAELMGFINQVDFFTIYPTRTRLQKFLRDSVSDGDKIRMILRDEFIQRELFPDYDSWSRGMQDPVEHYLAVRVHLHT